MGTAGRGKKIAALFVIIFSFISLTPAHSALIYSTYGSNDTFGTQAFDIAEKHLWGFAFTPTFSARLDSITYTASATSPYASILLALYGSNGLPKSEKVFMTTTLFNSDPQTFEVQLNGYNILLTQGVQYWVTMESMGGTLHWSYGLNTPGSIVAAQGIDNYPTTLSTTWMTAAPGNIAAFRVEGTPLNGVPEPTTMLLFGLGLVGLAGAKRFRK